MSWSTSTQGAVADVVAETKTAIIASASYGSTELKKKAVAVADFTKQVIEAFAPAAPQAQLVVSCSGHVNEDSLSSYSLYVAEAYTPPEIPTEETTAATSAE